MVSVTHEKGPAETTPKLVLQMNAAAVRDLAAAIPTLQKSEGTIHRLDSTLKKQREQLCVMIESMIVTGAWREWIDKETLTIVRPASFVAFLRCSPPTGVGVEPEEIRDQLRKANDLRLLAKFENELVAKHGGDRSKTNNVRLADDEGAGE